VLPPFITLFDGEVAGLLLVVKFIMLLLLLDVVVVVDVDESERMGTVTLRFWICCGDIRRMSEDNSAGSEFT
jgi:hypothetical protein